MGFSFYVGIATYEKDGKILYQNSLWSSKQDAITYYDTWAKREPQVKPQLHKG